MYSECKLGRSVSLILKLQKGFISISYHNQSVFPLRVLQYQFRFHLICMWTQAFENVCQNIVLCTWNIRIQDFFFAILQNLGQSKVNCNPFYLYFSRFKDFFPWKFLNMESYVKNIQFYFVKVFRDTKLQLCNRIYISLKGRK